MYQRTMYITEKAKKLPENIQEKVLNYINDKHVAKHKYKFDSFVADYLEKRFPEYDLYIRDDGCFFCKITSKCVPEAVVMLMMRRDYFEHCEKLNIAVNNRAFKYCSHMLLGGYYVNGILAGSPFPFTDAAFSDIEVEGLDAKNIL